ncbi:MAG: hypothetical protein EHM70_05460 [Chloroflexota bacterium]|nr:MAG: hypothetical protein EHM70_05460 [Chloroflexota bacterium]
MLTYTGEVYQLVFPEDRPFVFVEDEKGQRFGELFVLSSVHPLDGRDNTTLIAGWEVAEESGETLYMLRAKSSSWQAKTYRLRCSPRRFTYEIEVEGTGRLCEANYFGGYYSGHLRWGSGFFWSGQRFRGGFNPEPNVLEKYYFAPSETSLIDLMGVPLPGKGSWFFTPPPFCFCVQGPGGWLSLGVEAAPGQNRFTEYTYHGQPGSFYLSLSYEGHTTVQGRYTLPAIGFDFAEDEYAALAKHVERVAPARLAAPMRQIDWWCTPIFCGWGAQCYLASLDKGSPPDYARQELYESFIQALSCNDVHPGIVVLDDKWQAAYGENCVDTAKWPDLPGFVAGRHAAGSKVLLWLKAWDPEGLPSGECITNPAGLAIACDPSNPAYERRLREAVWRMLSLEGYHADGFKIDFTARIPSGPAIYTCGDTWGLELMREYLGIIYTEAKRAKPDALIVTHTPHPYLAGVLDMIRLNDINAGHPVNEAMIHRARVASIACPNALIDTDNWPIPDKNTWRSYLQLQPQLGVPALYYATHIDSTGEPLDESDYALIRLAWRRRQGSANSTQAQMA